MVQELVKGEAGVSFCVNWPKQLTNLKKGKGLIDIFAETN